MINVEKAKRNTKRATERQLITVDFRGSYIIYGKNVLRKYRGVFFWRGYV